MQEYDCFVRSIEIFDSRLYERPLSKSGIPGAIPDRSGLLLLFSGPQFLLSVKTKSVRLELEHTLDIPQAVSDWVGYTHYSFVECAPEYLRENAKTVIEHCHPARSLPDPQPAAWNRVPRYRRLVNRLIPPSSTSTGNWTGNGAGSGVGSQ